MFDYNANKGFVYIVEEETMAQTYERDAWEDEVEEQGRILTEEEYVKQLNGRADIFEIEKDRKMRKILPLSMIFGLTLGVWFASANLLEIDVSFIDLVKTTKVSLVEDIDLREPEPDPVIESKPASVAQTVSMRPKPTSVQAPSQGGGDPSKSITSKGILGILTGQTRGHTAVSASSNALSGSAKGLDAVLAGVQGLQSGGSDAPARSGEGSFGFGDGFTPGVGGGGGGLNDVNSLIASLTGGGGNSLELAPRDPVSIPEPEGVPSRNIVGGRPRSEIMRVVRQNSNSLQYAYTRRLSNVPGLSGKITVKWAIDEFGHVLFCSLESSTINDAELEQEILRKIKRWVFSRINKPGDVTEVVYPFVFNEQ